MKKMIFRPIDEWPTFALIFGCSAGILLLTGFGNHISLWVFVPGLSLLLALHSSLQHEALHGHPTRFPIINELLVFIPFGLFLPYRRFRDTHIQHHFDPNLTDPYDDPETNFQDPVVWAQTGTIMRLVYVFNNTLLGRMLIGPMISFLSFYKADAKLILSGDRKVILAYFLHFIGLIPFVYWLVYFSNTPFLAILFAAYLAISVLKIRTFLEHRAHENCSARSVIIEDRGFLALLFLNNNFHAVHHKCPKLAWYNIPANYAAHKAEYLLENDGYRYLSYRQIFSQYFFKNKDQVPHPLWSSEDKN